MRNFKICTHGGLLILLFVIGISKSIANCVVHPQPDGTANFGTVTVARNIPVGSVIASFQIPGTNNKEMECDAGAYGYFHFQMSYSTSQTSISDVYPTNLQGIGIRVVQNGFYFTNPYTSSPVWTGPTASVDADPTIVDLIKTSETPESGTLDMKQLAIKEFYYSSAEHQIRAYNMGSATIVVPPQSCTVESQTINASLGNHLTTEFTDKNSKTASVDIPVKLNCPANAFVYATLNATADTSTTEAGAIKLTPSSGLTATEVAVQILDSKGNGVPVGGITEFNPQTAGVVNFGWKARYLQTTSTPVTAGDANASATVTIHYE
jgi:type 1 fimbria pilin